MKLLEPALFAKTGEGGKAQERPTGAALAGKKFIGLLFSAQWCGPCRQFLPVLSEAYAGRTDKDEIEIVFISSDSDIDSFWTYYDMMPWLAVAYENRELADELNDKFGIQGIPALVILDATTGDIVTRDGRSKVDAAKKLCGIF